MLSLKILLSVCVTILINPGSSERINKRAAEASRNVQRYSFNQNHPPFAEEYAPIPVAIVFEEPSENKGKSIATTENTPMTFHPRFRNLEAVSVDVSKEASTLNSKDEETSTTSISSENTDKVATPTVDQNKNIQVKGRYNVENELQIPVAVVYDTQYTNLRSNPKVENAIANKLPYKFKDQKHEQREISDISISDEKSQGTHPTQPRTRSYDKIISRRNPQFPEKLDTPAEPPFAQSNAQKLETEDAERVKERPQQNRRQRPRIETENTTSRAVVPQIDNQASLNKRSKSTSSNGNPRQRLQPKTTVVNETTTELLNDKTVGITKSDIKSTEMLQHGTNIGDIKIMPKETQHDVIKYGKYEKNKETSNPQPNPPQRRKSITSSHDVKSDVILQKNEDVTSVGEKSKNLQQVTRNTTINQQRRRQSVNNPKPDTTYTSKTQESNEQTTIKNAPSEIIKEVKQSHDGETPASVALESPTTERVRDKYQNPPQKKQPNIESVSLNADKTAETNTGSQPGKKGSGFPAIVSTTNSRTQPQRRRQPIRRAKQDDKAVDVIATQISDIDTKEKEVSIQSPSESSVTGTSETVKKSRKRDPVVPIIESENHVYGNTGKFHYSYESGDGTKQYGDGVLKPFEDDVNGESVVGGFSYTDKDGNDFSLTYTADENGYRPVGAHLPTPPPIPPAIARALAYLATKTTPAEQDEVTESL